MLRYRKKLAAPVVILGTFREHFEQNRRIEQIIEATRQQHRFATNNHNVGISIQAGIGQVNAHIRRKRLAGGRFEVLNDLTIYIVANAVVVAGCTSRWDNFAVKKLALVECLPFGG